MVLEGLGQLFFSLWGDCLRCSVSMVATTQSAMACPLIVKVHTSKTSVELSLIT